MSDEDTVYEKDRREAEAGGEENPPAASAAAEAPRREPEAPGSDPAEDATILADAADAADEATRLAEPSADATQLADLPPDPPTQLADSPSDPTTRLAAAEPPQLAADEVTRLADDLESPTRLVADPAEAAGGEEDPGPTRVMGADDAPDDSGLTRVMVDPDEHASGSGDVVATQEVDASLAAGTGPDGTRVLPSESGVRSTVYGSAATPSELARPSAPAPKPATALERQQLSPGTVLFGEYEIVDVLGAGGMGEVYRAHHRRLDETRAIKVMHPNVASDPTAAEFFDREAKALISVRHDAVVYCHDLLSDAEGRVYLVMEMIDGISLADRIRSGGALPVEEVRVLAQRVGDGLAAAHRKGVIHRDLSPDNIILPGGRAEDAKLIDFGIAKVLASGQETILEGFKGKLAYASPEQLGFFDGRIDGRSDMYSLGLVLYVAATGGALAMGTSVVEAVDARRQLTTVPSDCPEELREDIQALLALHPEDRPETLSGRFATDAGSAAASVSAPNRTVPLALGGLGVALIAAVAFFSLRAPEPLDASPVAVVGGETPVEEGEQEPQAPVVAVTPEAKPAPKPKPKPATDRRISATQRLRVMGLLRGGQNALERDALMSPPGDNAYEKFKQVLRLDSRNSEARAGIDAVAARYIVLARAAIENDELDRADEYLANARKAAPRHPDLAAANAAARAKRGG